MAISAIREQAAPGGAVFRTARGPWRTENPGQAADPIDRPRADCNGMPTIAQPISLPRPVPRRIAASPKLIAALLVGAGLLALALAKSGPLLDALKRAAEADRRWVVAAVGLEVASIAGYVLLLHHVVTRTAPALGWRHSYSLSVGGTAASRLLPTAGLGGVALSVVVLRRAGLKPAAIAERMLAFLLLLYSVFVGSLLVLGVLLATGALPAHGPRLVA